MISFEWLELQLHGAVAAGTFSGSILITQTGSDDFSFAGGLADRAHGTPVTERTRFGTASVTKMFTATAVLRLVEKGTIGLEDKLIDLVSEELRPAQLDPRVTVDHLLSHRSGIADYFDEETLGAAAYEKLWEVRPVSQMRSPRDFIPLMRDLPPEREPGGGVIHYNNSGYVLLGIVLEEVSGKSYYQVIDDEVFGPAGMIESAFLAVDEIHRELATGYVREEGSTKLRSNIFSIPVIGGADGGACCTAQDLDRFLNATIDGTLVSSSTLALMSSPRGYFEGGRWGHGLGFMTKAQGPRMYGKDGEDPGFSARAFHYPDLQMNVVMLANEIEATAPFFKAVCDRAASS